MQVKTQCFAEGMADFRKFAIDNLNSRYGLSYMRSLQRIETVFPASLETY
jgi:hypothetical protein